MNQNNDLGREREYLEGYQDAINGAFPRKTTEAYNRGYSDYHCNQNRAVNQ